ncbi:50S ribosomal protein L6 [Candidatus Parcubacteria bacterium]|nr:50S ribosomal protein L6 [Candidatus Parcubacteria bacterium]
MSRVGKLPVKLPSGVNVEIGSDAIVVSGSKGTLSQTLLPGVKITQENNQIIVTRDNEEQIYRSNHGLMRSLIDNMIVGVSSGFEKKLEINGVGFRVALAGSNLKMQLGLSHEVVYKIPEGIKADVAQNTIAISGFDKQKVGQVAAEIRSLKKPEPYKGKGIMYAGERIIRKSGKSGKDK